MEFKPYDPKAIEPKWQKRWADSHVFEAKNDYTMPKFYGLIEFPYPSGQGLHVGHPRSNTAMDIIARKRRMEGCNVLFPIGWDAFGLPTENYAIKNKVHPAIVTKKNIDHFREQLQKIGFSFDYSREVNTTDPSYYRWTQWIFLQLFKHGLAYKSEMPINWCPSCKCGLANEEVVGGVCERCGTQVIRKVKKQWMLKITAYAQKLLDGLDTVDFIDKVKVQQRNWIGRSVGAEVDFSLTVPGEKVRVFTTRPDTLFGATYMVLSPEHPLIDKLKDQITNYDACMAYRAEAAKKSDFERAELAKDKTGVQIEGVRAVNPVNGKKIPIWLSDYVLMTYGTGAIMAVPAHDTRDWEFAHKFGIPMIEVVAGGNIEEAAYTDIQDGVMVNSGFLDGMKVAQAKEAIIEYLEKNGLGEKKVNYKLRDWVFSRQRYWGEPIPIVHCDKCGMVAVPEDQLPVTLPMVDNYEPTDSGESPLSVMHDWVNTTCPCCGGPATRETDTMPQWAGSSWYFMRYCDPHCETAIASPEALRYWLPVDWYNGGMEHTTLHLLYSRFWHKFLYDIGVVHTKEPYAKRTSHGMILGQNPHYVGNVSTQEEKDALIAKYGNQALRPAVKMSKSLGNVVNPDDVVKAYGADTMRLYIMFIGDFEKVATWSDDAVKGCKRFLDRVWNLADQVTEEDGVSEKNAPIVHKTIKKVTDDIDTLKMNTAIAALMAMVNEFYANGISRGDFEALLLMLSPFAPHMVEELWEQKGFAAEHEGKMAMQCDWPVYDESKTVASSVEMAVQVGGKFKGTITVPVDSDQDTVVEAAKANEKVAKALAGMQIIKVIHVKNKLVNLIVKPC